MPPGPSREESPPGKGLFDGPEFMKVGLLWINTGNFDFMGASEPQALL